MHTQAAAQEDRATSVTQDVRPSMPWRVREVAALDGFRLSVRFIDGTVGTVEMSALIASPDAGVFAQLKDRSLFCSGPYPARGRRLAWGAGPGS